MFETEVASCAIAIRERLLHARQYMPHRWSDPSFSGGFKFVAMEMNSGPESFLD